MLIRRYLNYRKTILGNSDNTIRNYGIDIELFLRFLALSRTENEKGLDEYIKQHKKELIVKATRDDVLNFMFYLAEDNLSSPATRKRRISAIKGFYKYLKNEEGLITENPAEDIPLPKIEKTVPVYLTADEARLLIQTAKDYSKYPQRDVCILTFFLNLGIRLNELSKINTSDIKSNQKIVIYGKGQKQRELLLNDACITAYTEYLAFRTPNDSDNALFTSQQRKRMSDDMIYRMVKKFAMIAGLDAKISPHKLRHSFATLVLESDPDAILPLQMAMGHESMETTKKYTHITSKKQDELMRLNPLNK